LRISSFIAALLLGSSLFSLPAVAEDRPADSAEAAEYEMDAWTSAKEINSIEAYELYLADYAKGRHAKFAQAAINKLKKEELRLQQEAGNSVKEIEPSKRPATQAEPVVNVVGAEQKSVGSPVESKPASTDSSAASTAPTQ
jgi:hypothetical protein